MGFPKFRIGDKVRVNKRAPKYIREEFKRSRTRTIVDICYDDRAQHCLYELGGRGKSMVGYWFRGYMLTPVTETAKTIMGRPKTKRKYTRRQAMEAEIKEEGILEVKDQVMTRHLFDQLRQLDELRDQALFKDQLTGILGYVIQTIKGDQDLQVIWYIGRLAGTLVKVREIDIWWTFHPTGEGEEAFIKEAEGLKLRVFELVQLKVGEFRSTLPQIFTK